MLYNIRDDQTDTESMFKNYLLNWHTIRIKSHKSVLGAGNVHHAQQCRHPLSSSCYWQLYVEFLSYSRYSLGCFVLVHQVNVGCFCVHFLLNNTQKKYGVERSGDHRSHSPWQMMWSAQNLQIICIDEVAMWAVALFYCSQQYRSSFSTKVISCLLIFLVSLGCYCFLWKRIGASTVC